ncbi:uncharacterized protein LOC110103708 [Dendrobium catenatum]|uniref:uncharacterized protein LOC110103708 n=1 Tax=Dendrobium catenatum TaxID=906689 RepID=UPI0009F644A3|nr:uncharacterized protein LOC110103708 [Dendrobium catenatum]
MSLPPIGAWNVRGFNNPVKVKMCKDLISMFNLKLIFILEAKIQSDALQDDWFNYSHSLFDNESCCHNFSFSSPGRIWVKWDSSSLLFNPIFTSSQVIHGSINLGCLPLFHVTVIYASNSAEERKELWDSLLNIAVNMDFPWVLMGDFNCHRFDLEKAGGVPSSIYRLGELNSFMFDSGLQDLKSVGLLYTWFNQRPDNPIHIKLDRMLINSSFLDLFPLAYYKVDSHSGFDHAPSILFANTQKKGFSRFMFKEFWLSFDNLWDELLTAFDRPLAASPIASLYDSLVSLKCAIKRNNWCSSNYLSNNILELKNQQALCLEQIQRDPLSLELNFRLKNTNEQMASAQVAWSSWISQGVKAYWLSQGEDDLGFLFAKIRARTNRNMIKELATSSGLLTSHSEISKALVDHFHSLLNAPAPPFENSYNIHAGNTVPPQALAALTAPITNEEIKKVVFGGWLPLLRAQMAILLLFIRKPG